MHVSSWMMFAMKNKRTWQKIYYINSYMKIKIVAPWHICFFSCLKITRFYAIVTLTKILTLKRECTKNILAFKYQERKKKALKFFLIQYNLVSRLVGPPYTAPKKENYGPYIAWVWPYTDNAVYIRSYLSYTRFVFFLIWRSDI